jgi:hypothetical protein
MKTRVISLLILSIVLAAAPAAMAQCLKCRPINHTCVPTTIGGFDSCYWLGPDCILGEFCGNLAAATQPLASEYEVASVERADEPQATPNETRIALLEPTPAPKPKPASAAQR